MGRMKAKHRIADRLFFLLLTILVFFLLRKQQKGYYSFCRVCTFCECIYGRSYLANFEHTYRTDAGSAYGRFEQ